MTPCLLLAAALCQAPSKFPEASHGGGSLKYVNGVPVLTVRGGPAEIGEQFGVLGVKNAPDLDGLLGRFLKDIGQAENYQGLKVLAGSLGKRLPADHQAEIRAMAKASGREPEMLLFALTAADLSSGLGCSSLIVEPGHSATGGPLFGRNLDWAPTKGLPDHTLVTVCRPTGKRAFASVGFSPVLGVVSGMNDAGLAVAIHEVFLKQLPVNPGFNWIGTPLLAQFRRVLEECGTVAEAEKLVRAGKWTTSCCMTICDVNGGAVFEITPKTVQVRPAADGVCCCTNHFCTDGLRIDKQAARCERLPTLEAVRKEDGKRSVADVFARLDTVHQGRLTLQSMVFEPKVRRLHLKYGDGPATKREPVTIELKEMLR